MKIEESQLEYRSCCVVVVVLKLALKQAGCPHSTPLTLGGLEIKEKT